MKQPKEDKDLVTVKEASAITGWEPRIFYHYLRQGRPIGLRVKGVWHIHQSEVDRIVQSAKRLAKVFGVDEDELLKPPYPKPTRVKWRNRDGTVNLAKMKEDLDRRAIEQATRLLRDTQSMRLPLPASDPLKPPEK